MSEQLSLFDFSPAIVARDEAFERIESNNEEWMRLAVLQVEQMQRYKPSDFPSEFRAEQLNYRLRHHIGEPTKPKAWGALINKLIRMNFIEKTGRYEPMQAERSHGRETKVYRWRDA